MTPPAQEIHSSPYLNVVGVGVVTGLDALSVAPPLVPYGHLGARWKWCVLLGGSMGVPGLPGGLRGHEVRPSGPMPG